MPLFYFRDMKDFIKNIFEDNKKRHIATVVVIIPFLIVIVVMGVLLFKEAKGLIGSVGGGATSNTNPNYSINNGSFVLRENATDVQKEYFAELKNIYENNNGEYSEKDLVASTVKNFIADFYTWSNKQGQYDVGGTYYLFTPQRQTIYIQARDQFYKYINEYINQYGADALLEVESVTVDSVGEPFSFVFDEQEYSAYKVVATWNYVSKDSGFSTSSYETKAHFVVINNFERYEIIYLGDKEYSEADE